MHASGKKGDNNLHPFSLFIRRFLWRSLPLAKKKYTTLHLFYIPPGRKPRRKPPLVPSRKEHRRWRQLHLPPGVWQSSTIINPFGEPLSRFLSPSLSPAATDRLYPIRIKVFRPRHTNLSPAIDANCHHPPHVPVIYMHPVLLFITAVDRRYTRISWKRIIRLPPRLTVDSSLRLISFTSLMATRNLVV